MAMIVLAAVSELGPARVIQQRLRAGGVSALIVPPTLPAERCDARHRPANADDYTVEVAAGDEHEARTRLAAPDTRPHDIVQPLAQRLKRTAKSFYAALTYREPGRAATSRNGEAGGSEPPASARRS